MSSLNKKKKSFWPKNYISEVMNNNNTYTSWITTDNTTYDNYVNAPKEQKSTALKLDVSILKSNKIPEGYRTLKDKEIIAKNDLCYNLYEDLMGSSRPWFKVDEKDIGKEFNEAWQPMCRKIKILEITEELQNNILFKLKSERAFNGDSALKMEGNDFDICENLMNNGRIKCVDNDRFYLEAKISS